MIVSGDTVLCATSGTERDLVVIEVAGTLARRTCRSLDVVHVEPPIATAAAVAGAVAHPPLAPTSDETEALRRRLAALVALAGQHDAVCEVVEGAPRMTLQERSQSPSIAWLVLEDPGGGALRSALEGTVSRHLLIEAGCPLMLVPPAAGATAVEHPGAIVCAVGCDEIEAAAATAVAGALARDLGAPLTVVHAIDPAGAPRAPSERPPEIDRLLDRCLALIPTEVDARPVAVAGSPTEALHAVAVADEAGIVVMGCPSRGPLRSAIGGSVPHRVLDALDRQLAVVVPEPVATGIGRRGAAE